MNEGPGSGFLARTGSSSLVFIPLPPQKKNTLRVKVGWPVYDPIFSFFSL